MRGWVATRLPNGVPWPVAVVIVLVVTKLLGFIGWPWHLILIPLWLPIVTGAVLLLLGKLGLVDIEDLK